MRASGLWLSMLSDGRGTCVGGLGSTGLMMRICRRARPFFSFFSFLFFSFSLGVLLFVTALMSFYMYVSMFVSTFRSSQTVDVHVRFLYPGRLVSLSSLMLDSRSYFAGLIIPYLRSM